MEYVYWNKVEEAQRVLIKNLIRLNEYGDVSYSVCWDKSTEKITVCIDYDFNGNTGKMISLYMGTLNSIETIEYDYRKIIKNLTKEAL
jgi:hypothetical protein